MTILKLKANYEVTVQAYIDYFCKKEDLEFDGWIGATIGELAYINDYLLDFNDIRLSVDLDMPVGVIIEWNDSSIEYALDNDLSDYQINLHSYFNGMRYEHLNK